MEAFLGSKDSVANRLSDTVLCTGGMQLMSSPVGVWTMHHIQRCWSWPTWRWLTGACILGLIISAVVVREADHGHVHHLTRGFFSLVPSRRSEQVQRAHVLPPHVSLWCTA